MKYLINKFKNAFNGLYKGIAYDSSIQTQVAIGCVTVLISLILGVKRDDLITILFLIGFVIALEFMNTAIERTCDRITKDYCKEIGLIKDLAAGAVLIASLTALIVGIIIIKDYI